MTTEPASVIAARQLAEEARSRAASAPGRPRHRRRIEPLPAVVRSP